MIRGCKAHSLHRAFLPALLIVACNVVTVRAQTGTGAAGSCTFDMAQAPLTDFALMFTPGEDPVFGDPESPVILVEFVDPNCPHCKSLHEIMGGVMADYADRVRLYVRPMPLWDYSIPQIEAILLAGEQGKFYEMLDLQMTRQKRGGFAYPELVALARELQLDEGAFVAGLQNGSMRRKALETRQLFVQAGFNSVPRLLLNGNLISGASRTADCIGTLLDHEIETAGSAGGR